PKTWVVWTAIIAAIVMLILFNHQRMSQPNTIMSSDFLRKMDAVPCQIAEAKLNYNPQLGILGEVEGTYYQVDDKGNLLKDKEKVQFRTQILLSERVQNQL